MRLIFLRFVVLAVGMGAAMTVALGDTAVGFALGLGIAASMSGRRHCHRATAPTAGV